MRKRLVAPAGVTLLVGVLMAGSTVAGTVSTAAAPACTTPKVTNTAVAPDTVVLAPGQQVPVEQKVHLQGNCVAQVMADQMSPTFVRTVGLEAGPGDDKAVTGAATSLTALPADGSTWRHRRVIAAAQLSNADAGTWHTRTHGQGAERFSVPGEDFRVLRSARIRAQVVKAARDHESEMIIRGRLSRADWDHDRFGGYGSQKIILQRVSEDGDLHTVRTLRSHRHGQFRTTVGREGGCLRLVFAGDTSTARATSPGECLGGYVNRSREK